MHVYSFGGRARPSLVYLPEFGVAPDPLVTGATRKLYLG